MKNKPLSFIENDKTLLIAELSANHDKDLDQALALVDIAANSGWDCIKLQTYTADSLTMNSSHPSMRVASKWKKKTLYELYLAASMPMEFHQPLFDHAHELGLAAITSVYDPMDLDFVESLNCPCYKIASFELTYDDLLRAVAETGKPIILSTGMADLTEIDHALEILDRHGSGTVVLLHCCSAYPAPFENINLRAMSEMAHRFHRPVGFSDHTIGARAALAASAMGAAAIEKHFTNDTTREGPDHRFSATPEILTEIAIGVGEIHVLRGQAQKVTTEAEQESKKRGRRSAFALSDLPAGHQLTENDFRFIRPNAGIPANCGSPLVGRTLKAAIPKGHPITWETIAA